MSANALIVTVLSVLVLIAAAARVVIGPVPVAGGNSLYAMAKAGPFPDRKAETVQMAVSDSPSAR